MRNSSLYAGLKLLTIVILLSGIVMLIAREEGENPAGSRLELLHADVSRGVVVDGKPLKILEGNVRARQDTLLLFCDRAVYNPPEKTIVLTGNVKLIRGKDTLIANRVTYFEEEKKAVSEGDVRVYRPEQNMTADYLEYYYETDRIRAMGNLQLHDAENRVFITAREGEYCPEENISYVQRQAHLWQLDSSGTDTLHIFGRRMEYYFGEPRNAVVKDSVHIFQGDLHAWCDSVIYLVEEEVAYLEKSPRALQKNNELLGKRMQLILKDMKLEQIRVQGGALAISVVDSTLKKENRLEGREIVMYISHQKMRELRAISNARSLYYLKEKEEERGVNTASADTIKAFFTDNELDSIVVIGGSQGTFYPRDYQGPIVQE